MMLVLVLAEYLSVRKGWHAELSRKFVHIIIGTFAAFWPFFLSWGQIQVLSLIALVGMLASIKLNFWRSMHSVQRSAHGEILSVLAVGILAFITTQPWIFTAAMLCLAFADGLAALVGLLWGDSNSYKVLGHTRSLAGSLAFFFTAVVIMVCYAAFSGASYNAVTVLWLPLAATIAENLAIKGTDNIVVPLLVALTLTSSL